MLNVYKLKMNIMKKICLSIFMSMVSLLTFAQFPSIMGPSGVYTEETISYTIEAGAYLSTTNFTINC